MWCLVRFFLGVSLVYCTRVEPFFLDFERKILLRKKCGV
jgi:hypothetical protein